MGQTLKKISNVTELIRLQSAEKLLSLENKTKHSRKKQILENNALVTEPFKNSYISRKKQG